MKHMLVLLALAVGIAGLTGSPADGQTLPGYTVLPLSAGKVSLSEGLPSVTRREFRQTADTYEESISVSDFAIHYVRRLKSGFAEGVDTRAILSNQIRAPSFQRFSMPNAVSELKSASNTLGTVHYAVAEGPEMRCFFYIQFFTAPNSTLPGGRDAAVTGNSCRARSLEDVAGFEGWMLGILARVRVGD